jgi:serine/threonine protein kinase
MAASVQEGAILLGKYRVEKELGRGAMGYVVAARHTHLDELFAVKLMLPEALEKPDAAARFLREARACARIKSEHVVRVTDSGENDDGVPVMVMEYLMGEDFQSILDKRRLFPMHEAVTYLLQICDAVAAAHELGIVHRDLKPSNLFLTHRPNGKPCVKVLDFGISKDLKPNDAKQFKLTATGSIMGTPSYMSPEQMQGKSVDGRGDIWSLGIILYEFVTGRLPFPGENYAEVAGRVLYKEPVPPSHLQRNLPPEFDAIVMRCLEKPTDKRFSSIKEFVSRLEPLLAFPETNDVSIAANAGFLADAEKDTLPQNEGFGDSTDDKPTIRNQPDEATDSTLTIPTPEKKSENSAKSDEALNEVPVFYAKRVFGHKSKSWASNTRSSRKFEKAAAFFLISWGLVGAGWYFRDEIVARVKAFSSPQPAPVDSATIPVNSIEAPPTSAAPSSSAALPPSSRPTAKPRSGGQATPKTSAAAPSAASVPASSAASAPPTSSAASPASTPKSSATAPPPGTSPAAVPVKN